MIPTRSINRLKDHHADAVYINQWVANTPEMQELTSKADIIVVERNYFGDSLTAMQYWKVRNKTVMCIFDDAYDIMHPKNISYRFWNYGEIRYMENTVDGSPIQGVNGSEVLVSSGGQQIIRNKADVVSAEKTTVMTPIPLEQFKWGLRIAKAVQVPSVNLQRDWSRYNPNTFHVHNFLDMDKYLNVLPLYPHDKEKEFTIGWCGSLSHYASFFDSGLLEALKRITTKYKNVRVLISGDKRIYDLLEVENKFFQPFVPAEKWTSLVKTLDIGLCPLAGEYDKRRSWIKALEYMALKVPWIASNYPTYDELHDYGTMTENGAKNWEESISKVIEDYSKYVELAETKAYEFALSQSSYNKIEEVTLPLYQKIIEMPYP